MEITYYPEGVDQLMEALHSEDLGFNRLGDRLEVGNLVTPLPETGLDQDQVLSAYNDLERRDRRILDLFFGIDVRGSPAMERKTYSAREVGGLIDSAFVYLSGRVYTLKERALIKLANKVLPHAK
jgi:hypothetical protein